MCVTRQLEADTRHRSEAGVFTPPRQASICSPQQRWTQILTKVRLNFTGKPLNQQQPPQRLKNPTIFKRHHPGASIIDLAAGQRH